MAHNTNSWRKTENQQIPKSNIHNRISCHLQCLDKNTSKHIKLYWTTSYRGNLLNSAVLTVKKASLLAPKIHLLAAPNLSLHTNGLAIKTISQKIPLITNCAITITVTISGTK